MVRCRLLILVYPVGLRPVVAIFLVRYASALKYFCDSRRVHLELECNFIMKVKRNREAFTADYGMRFSK